MELRNNISHFFIYYNMNEDQKEKLKQINIDIIFFFLLIVVSIISFYIIIEKKKTIYNINNLNKKQLNKLFKFNRYLIILIDLYFVINAYKSLINYINNEEDIETIKEQLILLISNTILLLGSILYIPLTNSDSIITR